MRLGYPRYRCLPAPGQSSAHQRSLRWLPPPLPIVPKRHVACLAVQCAEESPGDGFSASTINQGSGKVVDEVAAGQLEADGVVRLRAPQRLKYTQLSIAAPFAHGARESSCAPPSGLCS